MSINESEAEYGMDKAVGYDFADDESPQDHTHNYAVYVQLQARPPRQPRSHQIDQHARQEPERQQIYVSATEVIYIPTVVPPSLRSK